MRAARLRIVAASTDTGETTVNNVHRNILLTLTTVLAGATFAVACGDEDEVSTTGGVARAAPAYSADDAVRDALQKLEAQRNANVYTADDAVRDALQKLEAQRNAPRIYGSADALEHAALSPQPRIYGSADALERAALGNGPFEADTLDGPK
jgi:Arc/MetJ-type ribon-helix-helix transcriptional regulator